MIDLNGYTRIALCGYRKNGIRLCEELKKHDIDVTYILERNYEAFAELYKEIGIPIVGFNENYDFYKRAQAILLSGDLSEEIVRECLKIANIDLPVFSLEEK